MHMLWRLERHTHLLWAPASRRAAGDSRGVNLWWGVIDPGLTELRREDVFRAIAFMSPSRFLRRLFVWQASRKLKYSERAKTSREDSLSHRFIELARQLFSAWKLWWNELLFAAQRGQVLMVQ